MKILAAYSIVMLFMFISILIIINSTNMLLDCDINENYTCNITHASDFATNKVITFCLKLSKLLFKNHNFVNFNGFWTINIALFMIKIFVSYVGYLISKFVIRLLSCIILVCLKVILLIFIIQYIMNIFVSTHYLSELLNFNLELITNLIHKVKLTMF